MMDWGRTLAVMARFYGYKAWEVVQLTPDQLEMYLSNVGYIRFLEQMAQLQYSYSKMDDESIEKMLAAGQRPPDPNSIRARGWRAFIAAYNVLDDEDAREATAPARKLDMRPETAEAIVAWVESGEMSAGPDGARIWREDVMPIWGRLMATAGG